MPELITITGPIAAGKNTVAHLLAEHYASTDRTAVIVDVDDVAHMIATPGATAGLWFAAHQAHGALTAAWMRSPVDVVIAVGPIYTPDEQAALFDALPSETEMCRVLIDAPMAVTWDRANADQSRGASRQLEFHTSAHERFRSLAHDIPRDLSFDSGTTSASAITAAILDTRWTLLRDDRRF